jgi:hypothetical protein
MSQHFLFVPINYGWYRIYWTGGGEPAYIHEVWKWMPYKGYDIEEKDMELVSQRYYEEYEDRLEVSRKVKNFVEGYWDSLDRLKTRTYMLKNDKAFREEATKAYRQVKVK